jgi:hypothetical protein
MFPSITVWSNSPAAIALLKMTCPSTGFIHALRVAPNIKSAREAIGWVNWGIDPEEFGEQYNVIAVLKLLV